MRFAREVAWWLGWIVLMLMIIGGMSFLRQAYAEGSRGIIERPLPPVSREDVWGRPNPTTEPIPNYLMEPHPIQCRFFPWQIEASAIITKGWWTDPRSGIEWWSQEYDHTQDGHPDTAVLTRPLERYPARYGFDVDGDSRADWVFQDDAQDGQCRHVTIIKHPSVKNRL